MRFVKLEPFDKTVSGHRSYIDVDKVIAVVSVEDKESKSITEDGCIVYLPDFEFFSERFARRNCKSAAA